MIIKDDNIILEDKDYKNNFKKTRRYKNKKYRIINKPKDKETKIFINAFNEKDLRKRYELIYDYMMDYLTKQSTKYCDFKGDKCIANRCSNSIRRNNGCCYFRKEGMCKYLVNNKCSRPNITCKLFMCQTIEKQLGFSSIPKNYFLLKYFLNKKQRNILRYSFRLTKNEYIEKLIKKN